MKRLTLISTATLLCASQLMSQSSPKAAEFYHSKGENQKTAGHVFTIVGASMVLLGISTLIDSEKPEDPNEFSFELFNPSKGLGITSLAVGLTSVVCGVIAYSASKKNCQKAVNLSLGSQRLPEVFGQEIKTKSIPSFLIKIEF